MKRHNTTNTVDDSNAKDEKVSKFCYDHQMISRRMLFGSIVLIVGFGLLFRNLFGWNFNYFWPLTIIMVGLYIIFRRKNE